MKANMIMNSSVDSDLTMEDEHGGSTVNGVEGQILCNLDSTHQETFSISKQQQSCEQGQLSQRLQSQFPPTRCDSTPTTNRYDIIEEIGRGAYGVVYKALDNTTASTVAMKHIVFNPLKSKDGLPVSIIREIATLRELYHPNVVKLLDVNQTQSMSYCLIFEYLAQDLKVFIDQNQTGAGFAERHGLSPPVIKSFMKQILSGVAFCHCHRILHRDLKPGNVSFCLCTMNITFNFVLILILVLKASHLC